MKVFDFDQWYKNHIACLSQLDEAGFIDLTFLYDEERIW